MRASLPKEMDFSLTVLPDKDAEFFDMLIMVCYSLYIYIFNTKSNTFFKADNIEYIQPKSPTECTVKKLMIKM
jgi:hypothetical protein